MGKMKMKVPDVAKRLRMLDRFGYYCVVCGERFSSLACVTYEHVIPRSRGAKMMNNVVPSHFNCNQLRGTMGLADAWRKVEKLRKQLGEEQFESWLSKKVPDRNVPDFALQPPEFVRLLFSRNCKNFKGPVNETHPPKECIVDTGVIHEEEEQRIPVRGVG